MVASIWQSDRKARSTVAVDPPWPLTPIPVVTFGRNLGVDGADAQIEGRAGCAGSGTSRPRSVNSGQRLIRAPEAQARGQGACQKHQTGTSLADGAFAISPRLRWNSAFCRPTRPQDVQHFPPSALLGIASCSHAANSEAPEWTYLVSFRPFPLARAIYNSGASRNGRLRLSFRAFPRHGGRARVKHRLHILVPYPAASAVRR